MRLPYDLGEYVLEELLGSGGMGNVFRAVRKSDGEEFAVKTIHPHLTQLKNFMGRFHREAKLLKRLAHPHVVQVFDNGVCNRDGEEPVHYIVMEYVIGGSLTDVIIGKHSDEEVKKMTLSVKLDGKEKTVVIAKGVTRMLHQLAAILQEAHLLGIVHRDIKPDNIYITSPEWDVKLLDFGIARDSHDLQVSISQTGSVIGTPPYMSPEQCEGNSDVDIRSDLYALGVVAYECLSGTLPFMGPTTMAFLQQHLHMNPVPLLTLNPSLPKRLCKVVERLMAKERLMRHQTPAELTEDLVRIERGWPPLKIYDFESRALFDSADRGGEKVASAKVPHTLQTVAAGITKRRTPLPPPPDAVKKRSNLWPVVFVVISIIAIATYFLAPVLLVDETRRQPVEKTSEVVVPEKTTEPQIPREMVMESRWEEFDGHVSRGEIAHAEGKYDDAIRAFTAALALNDDETVKTKLMQSEKALQAEKLTLQRTDEFNRLVSEGDLASGINDWGRAIASYGEALKIFNDGAVRAKLTHVESERDILLRNQDRQGKLAEEISKGDEAVEWGEYAKAQGHYSEAVKLSGEGANTSLLELLEKKSISASKLADAKGRMDKAKFEYDYLSESDALEDFLSEREVARYRTRLKELDRLITLVAELENAQMDKDWAEVIKVAEELGEEGYPPAKAALANAAEEIKVVELSRFIEDAEKAGEYEIALLKLKELQDIRADEKYIEWEETIKLKQALENEKIVFNRYISEAEKAIREGRAKDAMSEARNACSTYPNSEKAKELLERSISMNQRDMAESKLCNEPLKFDNKCVTSIAYGKSGLIVGAGPSTMSPQGNGSIYALEKKGKRLIAENAHSSVISGIGIWKDRVVSASFDGTVKVWDLKHGILRETFDITEKVWALAVTDKCVLAGTKKGQIVCIDTATWSKTTELKLDKPVRSIACCEGFAYVTNGPEIIKLSLPGLEKQASQSVDGNARGLVIVGDNKLAVGDSKGIIHILNRSDLAPVSKWKAHSQFITSLVASVDNKIIVSSSMDGTVGFWSVDNGGEIGRLQNAGMLIRELVFSPEIIFAASEISGLMKFSISK